MHPDLALAPEAHRRPHRAPVPERRAPPPASWPLPHRRDPDDKCDPVELLVDITFVLALAQAGSILRQEPGLGPGSLPRGGPPCRSSDACGSTASSSPVLDGGRSEPVVKLLSIAQTGMFLGLAILAAPRPSPPAPGGFDGPILFAAVHDPGRAPASAGCGRPHRSASARQRGKPDGVRRSRPLQLSAGNLGCRCWCPSGARSRGVLRRVRACSSPSASCPRSRRTNGFGFGSAPRLDAVRHPGVRGAVRRRVHGGVAA